MHTLLISISLLTLFVSGSLAADPPDGAGFLPPQPGDACFDFLKTTPAPSAPVATANLPAPPPAKDGTWTFLFYDDADFSNAYDPIHDFAADAYPTDRVDIIVLQDKSDGPATYRAVPGDGTAPVLVALGEVDMGASTTLRDFIIEAKTRYPADRYLLALYDHGAGWGGACTDVTDGNFLTMEKMRSGIAAAGGIDIIAFSAPCLMGSFEAAYELRDCVDVLIGSEELSGYVYWRTIMGNICGLLDGSAALTTKQVASSIIDIVVANPEPASYGWETELTMTAVETGALGPVVERLGELSEWVLDDFATRRGNLALARDASIEMGYGYYAEYHDIDLLDFIRQYAAIETDPTFQACALGLVTAFADAIVAEHHGVDMLDLGGLNIYFPNKADDLRDSYDTRDLDFPAETLWEEMFTELLGITAVGPAGDGLVLPVAVWPNPCQSSTSVAFGLDREGPVSLAIYDLAGRHVRTLCDGPQPAGQRTFVWDGRDAGGAGVASGSYFYRLVAGEARQSGRILLLR